MNGKLFRLNSFKCVLELTESECRSMHLGNKLKTFYITDDGNTMNFHVFEMRIGMAYSRPTKRPGTSWPDSLLVEHRVRSPVQA